MRRQKRIVVDRNCVKAVEKGGLHQQKGVLISNGKRERTW